MIKALRVKAAATEEEAIRTAEAVAWVDDSTAASILQTQANRLMAAARFLSCAAEALAEAEECDEALAALRIDRADRREES